MAEYFNVKRLVTSAYHPQTNGLCERMNGQIVKRCAKLSKNVNKNDWNERLSAVCYSIRIQNQKSTKYSPYYLLYGTESNMFVNSDECEDMIDIDDHFSESRRMNEMNENNEYVWSINEIMNRKIKKMFYNTIDNIDIDQSDLSDSLLENNNNIKDNLLKRNMIKHKVLTNIDKAQTKYKNDYDKKNSMEIKFDFKIGMLVMLRNSKDDNRKGGKLNAKWFGKYEICNIQNNVVELKNIDTNIIFKKKFNVCKIRPLYEFSNLKMKPNTENIILNECNSIEMNECNNITMNECASSINDNYSKYNIYNEHNYINYKNIQVQPGLNNEFNNIEMNECNNITMNECASSINDNYSKYNIYNEHNYINYKNIQVQPGLNNECNNIEMNECNNITMNECANINNCDTIIECEYSMNDYNISIESINDSEHETNIENNYINKIGKYLIKLDNIKTINHWLDDIIINAYLFMLSTKYGCHHIDSFLMNMWINGNYECGMSIDVSMFRFVIMGVNIDQIHWVLMVADTHKKEVYIIDSKGGTYRNQIENFRCVLR